VRQFGLVFTYVFADYGHTDCDVDPSFEWPYTWNVAKKCLSGIKKDEK